MDPRPVGTKPIGEFLAPYRKTIRFGTRLISDAKARCKAPSAKSKRTSSSVKGSARALSARGKPSRSISGGRDPRRGSKRPRTWGARGVAQKAP